MYLVRERYEHQKTDLYGFELKLGSFKAYMFSPSKTTSQKWVSLLKEHCVSDDFHSKFNIVSTLTEGTKERVRRIENREKLGVGLMYSLRRMECMHSG